MHPQIIPRPEHPISRKNIHPDALKVMYRLVRKGFTAYLVGGGVRDLVLGRRPKDFDVSTNATPNQIKRTFRNCFLIGRRFRLAHIRFGNQIIETSTFRRCPELDDNDSGELYVFRDNCYGSPEEDALRRDFTINALFYEIERFSIIDHVGGLSDIHNRLVRSIGDPNIRFCEDPVRMIRAIRFASRLDFRIEPATFNAILRHHQEILKASPPRVFEELLKLFSYGCGEKAFRLLYKTNLLCDLLPEIANFLDQDGCQESTFWSWLRHLDEQIKTTDRIDPVLVFATLLLSPMQRLVVAHAAVAKERGENAVLNTLLKDLAAPVCARISMPRWMAARMIQVMINQARFVPDKRRRFSKRGFVAQDCFPESLALYELGLRATGGDIDRCEPWNALHREVQVQQSDQTAGDESRLKQHKRRPRRRPRRNRGPVERIND